ncbi:ATP synthase subunit b 1 [Kordiimonas sediminis]|uniref:ATP synthase subunit b n=1 Tax=Kordiimonas sediminis TaxID=1735581 RepID=A0A919EAS0_9PROT|nr:F0F1 ATP synthase subunit B [Kordiimonas sediminis]GHF31037.1 ATP synthase subunit b 1 [Kordiimonas sediminis]
MAAGEAFYLDPTFWVAGSFVVFIGGVVYAKAHKTIGAMLDERSNAIRKQIEEARSLREETEQLLIDFQRKQRDAEKEAADMVAQANEDAKILADQAKADIDAMIKRRTRMASEKIAQAEAHAVKEVQAAAVAVAVEAASTVLGDALKGKAGTALIDKSIKETGAKLH